jgi:uncharacterized protein with HEPN domain
MSKDPARLRDMIAWAERAINHLGAATETEYLNSPMLQDACERCVEVVGEAAGSVSEVFRAQHPEVPWKKIKGMRNILIHQYGAVVPQTVYETVKTELPIIITTLRKALGE